MFILRVHHPPFSFFSCVVCSVLYPICVVWCLVIFPYPFKQMSHYIPSHRTESNFPRHIEVQIVFLCRHIFGFVGMTRWCAKIKSIVFPATCYSTEHVYFHSHKKKYINSVCLELGFMTIDKMQISLPGYDKVSWVRNEGKTTTLIQHLDHFKDCTLVQFLRNILLIILCIRQLLYCYSIF